VKNLLNPGGRPMLFKFIEDLRSEGYASLRLARSAEEVAS
jgi:hypothetical protein